MCYNKYRHKHLLWNKDDCTKRKRQAPPVFFFFGYFIAEINAAIAVITPATAVIVAATAISIFAIASAFSFVE